MFQNFIFNILFYSLLFQNSFGQSQNEIIGVVVNSDKSPIEGASISLYKWNDSTFVKAILTEQNGEYSFPKLKSNDYFYIISKSGYKNYLSDKTKIDTTINKSFVLQIMLIKDTSKILKEVSIKVKIPFIEKKLDKIVVTPDAMISNAGTNTFEVIEKLPGIMMDMNGSISLKGKSGVAVFIDDRPTYLSEADVANYLKSMPSSTVSTIEIMSNPPAKYDAAGNAGIINIRLKKNTLKGFNGGISLGYNQGMYARSNNNFSMNYRINKFNFYTILNYSINQVIQDLTINRKYYSTDGALNTGFTQHTLIHKRMANMGGKFGIDYYISDKSTLGIVVTGFNNRDNNSLDNLAKVSDGNQNTLKIVDASSPSKRLFTSGTANINYNYKIDKKGKEITFNADYLKYGSDLSQILTSQNFKPDYTFIDKTKLVSSLPSSIDIKTAKMDFNSPIFKSSKIELGAKTSFVHTDSKANFYDEVDSILTENNNFSNHFLYDENVNAGYINYTYEGSRLSIEAGFRAEQTSIKGHQLGNIEKPDTSFARNYISYFPTFFLSYKLDTNSYHQLGFSYGRRIDRPDYESMNPFTYPMDRFTLYGGNPYLQPTFSNNFELSHTFKNNFTTTLSYSLTTDVFNETIEQKNNIFYSRPGNVGQMETYGISFNGVFSISKWWTLNLYSEVMYNNSTGSIYGQPLHNSGTYWHIGPTNQFQINKRWSAELSGTYTSAVYMSQFIINPYGIIRIGVASKILKGKGTFKFNINDLFHTMRGGGDIQSLNQSSANWVSTFDSRIYMMTFSYRFSQGKLYADRKIGSADSEKSRVK